MGPIKLAQLNVNKSTTNTETIIGKAIDEKVDILLLQEINCYNNILKGIPRKYKTYIPSTNTYEKRSAIIILNKNLITQWVTVNNENIVCAVLLDGERKIYLISAYISPTLENRETVETLKLFMLGLQDGGIILCGDLNGRSTTWGDVKTNTKGKQIEELLQDCDLTAQVSNRPTFEVLRNGVLCRSVVDITASSQHLTSIIKDWKIDDNLDANSDHLPISFRLDVTWQKHQSTKYYTNNPKSWELFDKQLSDSLTELELSRPTDTNEFANQYVTRLKKVANYALRKKEKQSAKKPRWWTEEIQKLTNEVSKWRRKIVSTNNINNITRYVKMLNITRQKTKKKIEESKKETWKQFCKNLTSSDTWDPINKMIKYQKNPDPCCLKAQEKTLTAQESAVYLLNSTFPDYIPTTIIEIVIDENETKDPPFTLSEMKTIFTSVDKDKTPGIDGFTPIICERAKNLNNHLLLKLYNHCLENGVFPKIWKTARVVFIPKPKKSDYTLPSSYRPIGLLSVLSKGLEKLIYERLSWHLETTEKISTAQYGFRKNYSAEQAVYAITEDIRTSRKSKNAVLIAMDIEGAFDNAQWHQIINRLEEYRIPRNLINLIKDYLKDRYVETVHLGGYAKKQIHKGCTQGSVLGPLFWTLIINPLLESLKQNGIKSYAYADDVTVLIDGTKDKVERQIATLNKICTTWAAENQIKFSTTKTTSLWFKRQDPNLNVKIQNERTTEENKVKVLGVWFDVNMSMTVHLNQTMGKAKACAVKVASLAKSLFGYQPEIFKKIYEGVLIPKISYGISSWGNKLNLKSTQKMLKNLQRQYIIATHKLYPTTSGLSCWSLCGYEPITEQLLRIRLWKDIKLLEKRYQMVPEDRPIEKQQPYHKQICPWDTLPIETVQIAKNNETYSKIPIHLFTDGSKNEFGVGAAYCVKENDSFKVKKKFVLESSCTVFQSELLAIEKALDFIIESPKMEFIVWTDSLSSLQAIIKPHNTNMQIHSIKIKIMKIYSQAKKVILRYIKAHNGNEGNELADDLAKAATRKKTKKDFDIIPLATIKRQLREIYTEEIEKLYVKEVHEPQKLYFPHIPKIIIGNKFQHAYVTFITGHGYFLQHMARTNPRITEECTFCHTDAQTAQHVLLTCHRFSVYHQQIENILQQKHKPINIKSILELFEDERLNKIIFKIHNECRRSNLKYALNIHN